MVEAKNASFSFEKFTIPNFSYNDSDKPDTLLKLIFQPIGRFYSNKGLFEIELEVKAVDNDNLQNVVIYVKCIATFKFGDNLMLSDIPQYFYKNSIAIFFPYIRAFISTLTLQANTGLIMLGLMNLGNLEQELKDNTTDLTA